MKPNWPSPYYGASLAAFKLEKYERALSLVEKAITLSKSNLQEAVMVRETDKF